MNNYQGNQEQIQQNQQYDDGSNEDIFYSENSPLSDLNQFQEDEVDHIVSQGQISVQQSNLMQNQNNQTQIQNRQREENQQINNRALFKDQHLRLFDPIFNLDEIQGQNFLQSINNTPSQQQKKGKANEKKTKTTQKEKKKPIIDINSPEFKSLPLEVQQKQIEQQQYRSVRKNFSKNIWHLIRLYMRKKPHVLKTIFRMLNYQNIDIEHFKQYCHDAKISSINDFKSILGIPQKNDSKNQEVEQFSDLVKFEEKNVFSKILRIVTFKLSQEELVQMVLQSRMQYKYLFIRMRHYLISILFDEQLQKENQTQQINY